MSKKFSFKIYLSFRQTLSLQAESNIPYLKLTESPPQFSFVDLKQWQLLNCMSSSSYLISLPLLLI